MRLLLDLGNTRWKWMLEEGGSALSSGAVLAHEFSSLESSVKASSSNNSLSRILVSSVASQETDLKLSRWSKEVFNLQPKFAEVKKEFQGVTVAYRELKNLGVDRWLVLLAARRKNQQACLVIDAGSAITVDFMSAEGEHKGGLIVPGVAMMQNALFDKTAAVKIESLTLPQKWEPGRDTLQCVESGLSAMLKGFLSESVSFVGVGAKVLLTGGDADTLLSCLPASAEIHERLVLEGLMCLES